MVFWAPPVKHARHLVEISRVVVERVALKQLHASFVTILEQAASVRRVCLAICASIRRVDDV